MCESSQCAAASPALVLVQPVQHPSGRARQLLQVCARRRDPLHGRVERGAPAGVQDPERARVAEVRGVLQGPGEGRRDLGLGCRARGRVGPSCTKMGRIERAVVEERRHRFSADVGEAFAASSRMSRMVSFGSGSEETMTRRWQGRKTAARPPSRGSG